MKGGRDRKCCSIDVRTNVGRGGYIGGKPAERGKIGEAASGTRNGVGRLLADEDGDGDERMNKGIMVDIRTGRLAGKSASDGVARR